MGLLSSLFGGKSSEEKQTATQEDKNFDTLKYDGIRARNIHQLPYAIKCFENAIRLKEEPETMMLLANAYLQTDATDNARLQADYKSMDTACQNAIKLDENNATAYYMAAQAFRGLQNPIQAIVMLTKATVLNENYLEAYLLRAEVLWDMRQANDSLEDIDRVLSIHPENEDALLLKGKIQAALGDKDAAFKAFDQVLENNPFNENAYLLKGELDIELKELDAAIENYTEAIGTGKSQTAERRQGRLNRRYEESHQSGFGKRKSYQRKLSQFRNTSKPDLKNPRKKIHNSLVFSRKVLLLQRKQ